MPNKKYGGGITQLSKPFYISNGTFCWGAHALKGVDEKTFKAYSNVWGADKNTVFTEWRPRKIDRATFEFLNPVYVKDKNGVYDYKGQIKDADPVTFECLDSGFYSTEGDVTNSIWVKGYARDVNNVFYHDQMLGSASRISSADPKSFVSLGNNYGRDSNCVYYKKSKLQKADSKKWFYLGHCYSTDQKRIYYMNRIIPDIDVERFCVVTLPTVGNFATDGQIYLNNDKQITPEEFDISINKSISRAKLIVDGLREGR